MRRLLLNRIQNPDKKNETKRKPKQQQQWNEKITTTRICMSRWPLLFFFFDFLLHVCISSNGHVLFCLRNSKDLLYPWQAKILFRKSGKAVFVKGVRMPQAFAYKTGFEEFIDKFQTRQDDVFIVGFPRSGGTTQVASFLHFLTWLLFISEK